MNSDYLTEVQRLTSAIHCDGSEQGFMMALKGQIDENQRIKDRFREKEDAVDRDRKSVV